ncbi:MAG: DNA double-strand break repair nuclease NurA [Thermomicrobiales bacterium]
MTLDLSRVITQITDMVATVDPDHDRHRFDALRHLWETLDSNEVNSRLSNAKTSFLYASGSSDYRRVHALPALPDSFGVVATDGSMIVPDRHSPARYYLINTGTVHLRYGESPAAVMSATPDLRYAEDDLWVDTEARKLPVNDTILGLRRAVAELQAAAEALQSERLPSVAFVDGTLILWALESLDKPIVEPLLKSYVQALEAFTSLNQPVAGYISSPGATDLLGTLRVAICDYPDMGRTIDCNDCWKQLTEHGQIPHCEILPRVTDRYIVSQIAAIAPGQRTNVFPGRSKILARYGDDQWVEFFYLHTGREIARIEVPRWVARDPELLDRVHSVAFDQAQLGRGYPVALQEAHEQAVLSMADRRLVEETIERRLASHGVIVTHTGKDGSKRGRFV